MMPENFLKNLSNFFNHQRKVIFLFSLIMGFVIHFALYSTGTLGNPDTINAGLIYKAGKWETSLGRWSITFFDTLRGGVVSNVLVSILSILFMSLAAMFLIEVLEIKSGMGFQLLAAAFVIVSPAYAMMLTYYYCSDSYSAAVFFLVFGVWLLKKSNSRKIDLLAILCFTFALSIYQAYIGLAAILLIYDIILNILKSENSFRKNMQIVGRYALCGAASLIVYYLLTFTILKILGIPFADYSGAKNVSILNSIAVLPESIKKTYKTFYNYFFNDYLINNSNWNLSYFTVALFLLCLVMLIFFVIKNKVYKSVANTIALVIFIVLIPLMANVIRLITPAREISLLMAVPLGFVFPFIIGLVSYIYKSLSKKWIPWLVCWVLSFFIIFSYVFMDNATYMARRLTYDEIYGAAIRMLDRIELLYNSSESEKVMIVGNINENAYFSHDNMIYQMADGYVTDWGLTWNDYRGIQRCWNNIFMTYLGADINHYTDEEYLTVINSSEFASMEVFPNSDAISVIDGIIVVKLSDNPPTPY